MKIVTWNCNGALRKKLHCLNELDADLYVIQECENPETSTQALKEWADSFLWRGATKNKGIGVFAMNGLKVQKLNWQRKFTLPGAPTNSASATWNTEDLKEFLPFRVDNRFNAVAVSERVNLIWTLCLAVNVHLPGNRRHVAWES